MNGKTTLIYLAGPIDGISPEEARGWREDLAAITPSGVLLFNPCTAYHGVNAMTAKGADHINRHVIAHSSAVIANLSGPGRGFGTIREIEFARYCDKIVSVVVESPLDSLLAYDVHQALSTEEALEFVLEEYA